MKKILSLVLCLMMLAVSGAFAEEAAMPVYDFNPATIEGIEGEFVAAEELGLMFFCPAIMGQVELTEERLATGELFCVATEDNAWRMNAGIAPFTDLEGNAVTDLNGVVEVYTALGSPDAVVCVLNGLEAVMCTLPELGVMSVCFMLEDGNVLTFNFANLSDELFVPIVGVMASSIMPITVE